MTLFVSPAATSVSGGHVYNEAVLAAWPGEPPEHARLEGDWPDGPGTAETLAAALRGHDAAIVDGLVGAAHPDVLAAAERDGCAVALLVHLPLPDETGLTDERRRKLTERERAAIHACTTVVATSRTAAADLAARYERDDIGVAPPGVVQGSLAHGSTPPLILCLAALTPRKNHAGLAQALGHISHLDWQAVFAGGGDLGARAAVEGALAAAGIAERVALVGEVTGCDLEELWARADVLALPSFAETYGLVVTEAIAHGVPVVVAEGTGAVEALEDGEGPAPGITVDPHDPSEIADGLATVLANPGYGAFARARRVDLRSWSETAAVLLACLPGSTQKQNMTDTGRERAGRSGIGPGTTSTEGTS
ncbi:glycosyltransferase family 4 protein [Mobilicoccus massiliensis]|uniref:glycosyltransferase family 4 protein n=1 Tax=Mobilicoccus massiliensis TaxID=1522310 RepID=UPI000693A51D|nr:glycosyltransferase family 4 protein [Mobilicoccus massiliensis]